MAAYLQRRAWGEREPSFILWALGSRRGSCGMRLSASAPGTPPTKRSPCSAAPPKRPTGSTCDGRPYLPREVTRKQGERAWRGGGGSLTGWVRFGEARRKKLLRPDRFSLCCQR